MINSPPHPLPIRRRAFSLIEVLLAVFILAIGLIMVASIFPVGADWTRQATEDSVAQSIALNALSLIRDDYAPNSLSANTKNQLVGLGTTLQPLPNFTKIPIYTRTYQYGNTNPFPSQNPAGCYYYWTALGRKTPGQSATASTSYDLYIFVFRKGDVNQTFQLNADASTAADPTAYIPLKSATNSYKEVAASGSNYARDGADPAVAPLFPSGYHWFNEPTLVMGPYDAGVYSTALNKFTSLPYPPLGFIAVGATSGTVFRQGLDATASSPGAVARPPLTTTSIENVIFAPPADNTTTSPLIYVYQTTISF